MGKGRLSYRIMRGAAAAALSCASLSLSGCATYYAGIPLKGGAAHPELPSVTDHPGPAGSVSPPIGNPQLQTLTPTRRFLPHISGRCHASPIRDRSSLANEMQRASRFDFDCIYSRMGIDHAREMALSGFTDAIYLELFRLNPYVPNICSSSFRNELEELSGFGHPASQVSAGSIASFCGDKGAALEHYSRAYGNGAYYLRSHISELEKGFIIRTLKKN